MNRGMQGLGLLVLVGCGGADVQAQWASGADDAPYALVVPNLDDDDGDGEADWLSPGTEGDDDRTTVLLSNKARGTTLSLVGEPNVIRVYHEGRVVLGAGAPATWALPERGKDDTIEVQIEAVTWGPLGTLVLTDDKKEETATLQIMGSPPTLGHHLLETEQAWVLTLNFGGRSNNDAMVASLTDSLGDMMTVLPGPQYGDDPWMQDEVEHLGVWGPDARSNLLLDSIRDGNGWGGLDPFPETLAGANAWVETHGSGSVPSTYDAFGNLEVSPPVTVDGVDYPLGRIYYGWNGETGGFSDLGPSPDVRDYLEGLGAQPPFHVDTSWLCVGHIDEFTSFVPDPTAPRGFRFLIADTALGLATLRKRGDDTPLMRHTLQGYNGHNRPTVGSYVNDAALIAYNEDMQRDHIDPALEVFKAEIGLTEEEIIRVPSFFEEVVDPDFGVCGAAAVVPGMVNLLMITNEDGTGGKALMADPFVRSQGESQDDDVFVQAWRELLPDSVELVFVDDWFVYHMGLGEVHCATNQRRKPALSTIDVDAWLAEELGQ